MKHLHFYLLIAIVSLPPLVGTFVTPDLPHTHDGLVHLPRIASYFKALKDIQVPVRWAGDLNYGYGMPLFNFIYHVPYFIASLFLFLGFDLVNAFKVTLALSYLLSGVFMFAFSKVFFDDSRKAFLVTTLYQFAPFRLVELLIRGSFGEVYAYTFLPLVLLGLIMFFRKPMYRHFVLTAIATALLVLSHNSVSLLFFGVAVLFMIFFAKERKRFILGGLALLAGLLISAFYWIPAILEHRYTYGDLFMRNLYLEHFAPIQNFFIPNLFNSEQFQIGGVSIQIGLFHVLAVLLAIVKSRKNKLITYCLLLTVASLFFTQPISKMFWENVSFLRQFQFPWRFLSVVVFATSMLSVSFLTFSLFKRKIAYVLLLTLVVLSTAYFWRPQLGIDKIDENYYWNFPLSTTYYGETDVIWSAGPASSYPSQPIEVISGEGKITHFFKKSTLHTFTIDAKTDVTVVDQTQYFPGWRVYVNGQSVPIQFQDPSHRGLITFTTPAELSTVRVVFGETKLRLFANVLSAISFVSLFSVALARVRKSSFL